MSAFARPRAGRLAAAVIRAAAAHSIHVLVRLVSPFAR